MTDQDRWEAAKRLFHAALELDGAQRDAYLRGACAGDAALYEEVRSLLDWHGEATGFLETPASRVSGLPGPAADPRSLVGSTLGAWRIVDILGRGGMGVVYKARRDDAAFERLAAVKVVGAGTDSAEFLERFRRERQLLAALDHPNISRLIDGGSTPDGRPYFVMEFVDGIPVDRYCDEHRLSVDQRLALFRDVCAGVQFAHQNLVVHRDIKPDNILVTSDGVPKLLDFGIATLASGSPAAADVAAAHATWLLTPDFASPEQLQGGVVTTASDVYALGVLLHVLLTGVRPYRIGGTTPAALHTALAAATVRRPSEVAGESDGGARERALRRGTTPGRLARRLAGDLDAIVLRAISRDVASRYATVEQLVDDLERHRTSYPVAARGRPLAYLASTFVKRHAVAFAVGSAVAAFACAGVVAVVWQARVAAEAQARAERRFDDLRRLAHAFIFDVHDAIVNVPGTTEARALMVRTALAYLDGLAGEAVGDRGLQRELASAYVKVGDAQGHPTSANLGDTTSARASYERAIAITEALGRTAPDDVEAARTAALAHRRLADVLAWTGEFSAALEHCESSRRGFRAIGDRAGSTVEDRLQVGVAEIKLGDLLGNPNLPNLGRPDDAAARFDMALALLRDLDATAPDDRRVQRFLGIALERIGTMHELAGRWDRARQAYTGSFDIRRRLAGLSPHHDDIQRDYAIAYEKLGNVQRAEGDLAGAVENYRGALAQFERLADADPSNVAASRTVAINRETLGRTLLEMNRPSEAVDALTAALEAHRRLDAGGAAGRQARCDAARVAELLGDAWDAHERRGNAALPGSAACSMWTQSLEARRGASSGGGDACASDNDLQRLRDKLARCR